MKKILALILAALLVLSMGAVAFAETYTDQSSVTIKKVYKLVGAGDSPAETFTLEQVGSGAVIDGDAEFAPPLPTITGAAFAYDEATTGGVTKDITIELPPLTGDHAFTTVGVYEYTLKETAGNTAGVTYYANDIKLVVTVINGADNKLRIAGVHVEPKNVDGEYDSTEEGVSPKTDTFENTYYAGMLNVAKTVNGILGDKTKEFAFTVTFNAPAGKTWTNAITVPAGHGATNFQQDGNTYTFTLSDGDTVSFANIPFGVTYTVTEADYSDDGYTTTKDGDTGTIGDATQTAAFTNEKGGTPDTGVLLDNLPYVIIIGLVVLAGVVMILKRRNSER